MLGTRHRRSAYTTKYDERELPATAAEPEAVKQFFTFCIDLKQAHHTLRVQLQFLVGSHVAQSLFFLVVFC
jgi:hypothetical protein